MPCECLETGIEYAVKIVRSHINVNEEVRMLMECQGHPNIITLIELLKDDEYIYIVTEIVYGTELHDYKGISADDAKHLFLQLADAINFMHSKNIAHRDLKLENILITNSHPKTLKIVDFGFAARGDVLTKTCFTLEYVAPEILTNISYSRKCDIWALGVILYILLCGDAPFRPDDENSSRDEHIDQISAKILKGAFAESYSWSKVSNSAKDLIRRMLMVNQDERLNIKDVINHEWLISFRKYNNYRSTSTCSSYHTSSTTKALTNSRISELSDAYNEVNEKMNNHNSFIADRDSNESVIPNVNNNNKEEDHCSFILNLSEDEDKDTMFNDSIASDMWDEDFHGFDESEDFYGFEESEIKMNNKLLDLIEKYSKPIYTTSKIRRKIKANAKTSKKPVKPKVTTNVVKRNTRGRPKIPIVIKVEPNSVPEVKEEVELRRTGRARKQVITINPDDVLSWKDEQEIQFPDVIPAKIRRGAKRRNEIDDRDWLATRSSSKRRRK